MCARPRAEARLARKEPPARRSAPRVPPQTARSLRTTRTVDARLVADLYRVLMGMRRRSRRRGLLVGAAAGAAVAHHRGRRDEKKSSSLKSRRNMRRLPPTRRTRLEHLGQLHASGVLTDEEFASAKAKVIGS